MALWFNTKHFSLSSRGRFGFRLGPLAAYAGGVRRRSSSGSLVGGVLILALAAGLCLLLLECVAAVPGHIIGWTPSIGEIFKQNPPPGYIHSLYRNVVLGFVLSGAILLTALVWGIRSLNRQRVGQTTAIAAAIAAMLVVTAQLTHTGARHHKLDPAQAVGVNVGGSQPILRAAAAEAARGYAGTGFPQVDDIAYGKGWAVSPKHCGYSSYSDGLLGKAWTFKCTVDAQNRRTRRSTVLLATVTCYENEPSLHDCTSDAGHDVVDTRRSVGTR